jgi:toxin HigB-1
MEIGRETRFPEAWYQLLAQDGVNVSTSMPNMQNDRHVIFGTVENRFQACLTVSHSMQDGISWRVIRSFRSKDTAKLFRREQTRKYAGFENVAKRKLDHLNAVASLSDLAAIPGNHFEALSGDRLGQYSIRINDRWRICFEWKNPDAYSVEIVDYH